MNARPCGAALGVASLIALAWAAKALHGMRPLLPLSALTLTLAIAVGMVLRRVPGGRRWTPPVQLPLAAGMVLVGVQFDGEILDVVTPQMLGVLLGHWCLVGGMFSLCLWRRWVSPLEAATHGVGLSGCGLPALYAVCSGSPGVDAGLRRSAVLVVLLAGSVGFALMPWLVRVFEIPPEIGSAWFGITMTSTSEAVIMGADHSPASLRLVTVLRIATHVLQGLPILFCLALLARGEEGREPVGIRACVPTFLWGLLAFAMLSWLGMFAAAEREALASLTRWSLLAALAGIGLQLRPLELFRVPPRLLAVAFLCWGAAAGLTLALLHVAA